MFGVVIAGRPAIDAFRPVDQSKAVVEISNPGEVADLCFFLLPTSPTIPPGFGAVLYWAVAPFTNWYAPSFAYREVLGAVTPVRPSGIFRTGWPTHEQVAGVGAPVLQLGVSIEAEEVINNLQLHDAGMANRLQFARKIALDLFNFMTSFSQGSGNSEVMVIPTNVLDRWMVRFEEKYRRDPNFFLRNDS
ncbi:unnamed protein product [Phaeothamnion confervicola]